MIETLRRQMSPSFDGPAASSRTGLVWSHSSGEPASFCALGLMPWQRLNIGSKPALRPPANPGEKTDPDPPFGMVRPHAPHQVAYAITWARENYYLTHPAGVPAAHQDGRGNALHGSPANDRETQLSFRCVQVAAVAHDRQWH